VQRADHARRRCPFEQPAALRLGQRADETQPGGLAVAAQRGEQVDRAGPAVLVLGRAQMQRGPGRLVGAGPPGAAARRDRDAEQRQINGWRDGRGRRDSGR